MGELSDQVAIATGAASGIRCAGARLMAEAGTALVAAGLSPEGVRINALCPGSVETPRQAGFLGVPE